MAKYRECLPQLAGQRLLADGGLETSLIYHDGLDLPDFAAFVLLASAEGRAALLRYYQGYMDIARWWHCGLVLESATWRASADWALRLGYTGPELERLNREAVALLLALRAREETEASPLIISGSLGPRGDGYRVEGRMSAAEAQDYHAPQIQTLAQAGVDLISAFTLNYVEEAEGIVRAAVAAGMPVVISFTVETDGLLPTGQPLGDAIQTVDAATHAAPCYYMINCAHPRHFDSALDGDEAWLGRIRGVRANASRHSHAELDAACSLDDGDPWALAQDYAQLCRRLPQLAVLGGCCGTDHRHIAAIAAACFRP